MGSSVVYLEVAINQGQALHGPKEPAYAFLGDWGMSQKILDFKSCLLVYIAAWRWMKSVIFFSDNIDIAQSLCSIVP